MTQHRFLQRVSSCENGRCSSRPPLLPCWPHSADQGVIMHTSSSKTPSYIPSSLDRDARVSCYLRLRRSLHLLEIVMQYNDGMFLSFCFFPPCSAFFSLFVVSSLFMCVYFCSSPLLVSPLLMYSIISFLSHFLLSIGYRLYTLKCKRMNQMVGTALFVVASMPPPCSSISLISSSPIIITHLHTGQIGYSKEYRRSTKG